MVLSWWSQDLVRRPNNQNGQIQKLIFDPYFPLSSPFEKFWSIVLCLGESCQILLYLPCKAFLLQSGWENPNEPNCRVLGGAFLRSSRRPKMMNGIACFSVECLSFSCRCNHVERFFLSHCVNILSVCTIILKEMVVQILSMWPWAYSFKFRGNLFAGDSWSTAHSEVRDSQRG